MVVKVGRENLSSLLTLLFHWREILEQRGLLANIRRERERERERDRFFISSIQNSNSSVTYQLCGTEHTFRGAIPKATILLSSCHYNHSLMITEKGLLMQTHQVESWTLLSLDIQTHC